MAGNDPIRNGLSRIRISNEDKGEEMMKRVLLGLVAAVALCFAATGCHTVHGAGEDISNAGQTIQNNTP